ncbi:MAG: hypothetical protein PHS52_04815 [Desulfotomaculaceae bacterium]|nr:hypothetical protein [Desulfotomaculaceae bacterium]
MGKFTLTIIETTGIQNYIYASNNLRQNIGASELVYRATNDWVYEVLQELGSTNITPNHENKVSKLIFKNKGIEDGGLTSELIYTGGGNAVIIFSKLDIAKEFAKRLSRIVLLHAPGLQVIIKHKEFNWYNNPSLSETLIKLTGELNAKKANRPVSTPLLGLGVTANCQYTGLPAICEKDLGEGEIKRVSAEIEAKLDAFSAAHNRLLSIIALDNCKGSYEIPVLLDDFGLDKGKSSYIAVVHTDGNGMGKRVNTIAKNFSSCIDNRRYIEEMRKLSQSINKAAEKALKGTVDQLIRSIEDKNGVKKVAGVVELKNNYLPFRPIVFGGDDATFICNGRLGLTLAQNYLSLFTGSPLSDRLPHTARAGAAIVKAHYPFARAYSLAEELTKSAKERIRELSFDGINESVIDWHFATSGLTRSLDVLREQDFMTDDRFLLMRPIRLGGAIGADWRTWSLFSSMIKEFQSSKWSSRRNKLKDLQSALRKGEETVRQFRKIYRLPCLPAVSGNDVAKDIGYIDKRCTCYDALEALDFFVPLEVDAPC